MGAPANGQGDAEEHARLLVNSYRVRTSKELLPMDNNRSWAEQLFNAPIVILSHGTEVDPVLNYGNQAALTLWEMDWDTFTRRSISLYSRDDGTPGKGQIFAGGK